MGTSIRLEKEEKYMGQTKAREKNRERETEWSEGSREKKKSKLKTN